MNNHSEVYYREVQRPRQLLWWGINILVAVFMWYWFIQQIIFGIPMGNKPAPDVVTIIFWLIFGIAFPVVMLGVVKLIIEVRDDGIYIRYAPFHIRYRQYLFKDIHHYESITYSPLKRFGGWGIRFNLDGETAYNLNGKEGLELKMRRDTVVIGTEKPAELIKAIDMAQKTNE